MVEHDHHRNDAEETDDPSVSSVVFRGLESGHRKLQK